MTEYQKTEAARWRIIVAINPSPKPDSRFYAELSKVNLAGQPYGVKYYRYYDSPREAFEAMYKFAYEENIIMTEQQLRELGFYESWVDPNKIQCVECVDNDDGQRGEEDG